MAGEFPRGSLLAGLYPLSFINRDILALEICTNISVFVVPRGVPRGPQGVLGASSGVPRGVPRGPRGVPRGPKGVPAGSPAVPGGSGGSLGSLGILFIRMTS